MPDLSVDLFCDFRRVAVEVDGPDHFTRSMPRRLLGSSLAKQRCLQARGWAVLSVPFYKWNDLATTPLSLLQRQRQHEGIGFPQQQETALHSADAKAGVAASVGSSECGCTATMSGRRSRITASKDIPALSSAVGEGGVAADVGPCLAAARAQYLATALDAAVSMADVPRGMPELRQPFSTAEWSPAL